MDGIQYQQHPKTGLSFVCAMKIEFIIASCRGKKITVDCEGSIQNWIWNFEDIECNVVSIPD